MRLSPASKLNLFYLALALVVGATIFLSVSDPRAARPEPPRGFVRAAGTRFVVDGEPFRYAGANVAVMYKDEDRAQMPATLRHAAHLGLKVVRVWANGEGRPEDGVMSVGGDKSDWPRTHPFRPTPDRWNEDAFVHLDRVLAEAARNHLRVQLTLANWWRDTGGVTQYLRWAGVRDAADDKAPYGVNAERAMEFYSNETTKRLYKEHVAKIAARRNTVTGILYRDDPTIFSYELMNEAQAPTGRWGERRVWVAEMSAYLKSLDPNHMIESGSWAYRSALERRAWLEEQKIPTLDYCDVHNYPRDDRDTYVTSPRALLEFLENRAAAAFSINKPLVVGEFGMSPDGFEGASQLEWFRALYDAALRTGTSGATFWILTPDPQRGYGVSYTTARDEDLRAEIARGAALLGARRDFSPPDELLRAGRHLVPRQFEFSRAPGDPEAQPQVAALGDTTKNGRQDAGVAKESGDVKNAQGGGDANNAQGSSGAGDARALVYRFNPESATRGRFEKLGGGQGYVWGSGVGFFEYTVPARPGWRAVSEIVVRAHVQPVIPSEAHGRFSSTRVTLFVNDRGCGSRLASLEQPPSALVQEWHVSSLAARLAAARGRPLSIRFEVSVETDQPFGINISNFPEGYNAGETKPVEVELR